MVNATVIGSGPNGLSAAIVLVRAGITTTVIEAQSVAGGGMRSSELTRPGFIHDVFSAVHPLAVASPVFKTFPLASHGLEWIDGDAPVAHPLANGSAVMLERSVERTAERLGSDGRMYRRVIEPLLRQWPALVDEILGPWHWPAHPLLMARFGALALWPAQSLATVLFKTPEARALFAGLAAHSLEPLSSPASAAIGLVLALSGHAVGWPAPRGGAGRIAQALVSYFQSLGGRLVLGQTVQSLAEIKDSEIILCDVTPKQLLRLAGDRLPDRYRRELEKFRYGPGAYKMDWALKGPIPWTNAECRRSNTVHVGGTLEDIAASELAPHEGRTADKPFVLLTQPSLFDHTRAPAGQQTAWAYCHVPNNSTADMAEIIESQIERLAPGFREQIIARHILKPADLEARNANLVGGDVNGGAQAGLQIFLRPTPSLYRTPVKGLYLCSASTPPGGGVHGMGGYHAARMALADWRLPMTGTTLDRH